MSAPVTLTNMILAVQQRCNIENQTGFIPLTEIRGRLNYACADIYDKLVTARAQPFFRSTYPIPGGVSPGVSIYALPADFYEMTSVDVAIGGQTLCAMPYQENERNDFTYAPDWTLTMPIYWRLYGSNINFIPTPNANYAVTLNYYPRFALFPTDGTGDALSFDGINGWEEGAIWRVVSELKDKGEEDFTYAAGRYLDVVQRIESLAAQRNAGNAERVNDVHRGYDSGWGWR